MLLRSNNTADSGSDTGGGGLRQPWWPAVTVAVSMTVFLCVSFMRHHRKFQQKRRALLEYMEYELLRNAPSPAKIPDSPRSANHSGCAARTTDNTRSDRGADGPPGSAQKAMEPSLSVALNGYTNRFIQRFFSPHVYPTEKGAEEQTLGGEVFPSKDFENSQSKKDISTLGTSKKNNKKFKYTTKGSPEKRADVYHLTVIPDSIQQPMDVNSGVEEEESVRWLDVTELQHTMV